MLSWRQGFQLAAHVPVQYWNRPLNAAAGARRTAAAGLAHHHAVHAVGLDVVLGRGDLDDRHPLVLRSHPAICCCWRYCLASLRTRCFQTRTALRALATLAFSSSTVGRAPAWRSGSARAPGWRRGRGGGRQGVSAATAAARAASADFQAVLGLARGRAWLGAACSSGRRRQPSRGRATAARAVATMRITTIAIQLLHRLTTSFRRGFPRGSGFQPVPTGRPAPGTPRPACERRSRGEEERKGRTDVGRRGRLVVRSGR